ncbi:MAG: hypothetical protein AB1511_09240 [Deinococcota bacterium]
MKQYTMMLITLVLGTAAAQTQTTNVSLPGTLPASVTRTQGDALKTFLAAGGQIELLSAAGTVIGTLQADGTVALVTGATLADVRTVRVLPGGQGEATTYSLARDLSKPGAIKFEVTGPNGQKLSLPLSAIVNRQAHTKLKTAEQEDESGQSEDQNQKGQAEADHGTGHGKAGNSGKGKGK